MEESAQAAWLRKALANNLRDELDKLKTAKRQTISERSLEEELAQSSARVRHWLALEQSTPSQAASRREQGIQLATALDTLPVNQRQAIELRHLKGLSLTEVAQAMETTKPAVVGLLHRGLANLRKQLAGLDGE